MAPASAVQRLKKLPYEDLGFAKVDHHRVLRRGFPEVIFGAGKTAGADRGHFPRPARPGRGGAGDQGGPGQGPGGVAPVPRAGPTTRTAPA